MKPHKHLAVAELPDCQQVLNSLLIYSPIHVYWKDVAGVYRGCNDKQARSLGLSRGPEVVGKTDFELPWSEKLAGQFWENDYRVMSTAQASVVEEQAIVDGKEAIVLSLKAPLKNNYGEVIGILGISLDISEQKRIEAKLVEAKEAAEAANYAKTEFLKNVRHNLRTPLVGIKGCTKAIIDNIRDPSKLALIEDCARDLDISGNALLTLFNTVIESVEVASGELPIRKEKFDLYETLNHLIELNQALAKHKNLALCFDHDECIPYVIGDSNRIQRIALELVTNALHFTLQGSVTITTRLVKRKGRTAIIKIEVADTGIGIPLAIQPDIFTPFKRGMSSYQGQYVGAGLGLSIIKQLVDELDGTIYFTSQPDEGTQFTCIFPLKTTLLTENRNEDNQATTQSKPSDVVLPFDKTAPLPSIHVLIVEDNAIAAKVTARLLEQLNCTADIADTAKSALDKAKQQQYDVILLDIGLPDGSGDKVATQIRQDDYCLNRQTPIIAVTAHAGKKEAELYLKSGINKVLIKPLSEKAFLEILQKLE